MMCACAFMRAVMRACVYAGVYAWVYACVYVCMRAHELSFQALSRLSDAVLKAIAEKVKNPLCVVCMRVYVCM